MSESQISQELAGRMVALLGRVGDDLARAGRILARPQATLLANIEAKRLLDGLAAEVRIVVDAAKAELDEGPARDNEEVLTDRQRLVLRHIRDHRRRTGNSPTLRELMNYLEIKSTNGVMCHLRALQKKGLIHLEPNTARSITLT